ncbi:hypothetical protein FBU30_002959 [Linnemannia zychae]|nr:hypothetical protein FBU30_002959 [Linnemannia zychae]
MVYATRSRAANKSSTLTTSAKKVLISTKNISTIISKKSPSTISRKTTISTQDNHGVHKRDGKEHQVIEDDGQDRHHIFFNDYSDRDNISHTYDENAQSRRTRSDRREPLSGNGSISVRRGRPMSRRDVANALRQSTSSSKKSIDEAPNSMDVDEHSRQLANLSNSSNGSSDEDEQLHSQHRRDSKSSSTIVTKHLSTSSPTLTKTTKSDTLLHLVSSTVTNRDGKRAVANYYKGGDSITTTTTTTTTHTDHDLLAKQRERAERHEAITQRLTQRSFSDRDKARDAILSLDQDVFLLQNLLKEKEDALRAAEARAAEFQQVTIRTETLTREIHDLEITIRDLRNNLQSKEKELKESQQQLVTDRLKDQEKQKLLEKEISKLSINLKDKEHVQQQSESLQKDLDDANKQRTRLIVQVREITDNLKEKEVQMLGAQSTIKKLENSKRIHSEETLRLNDKISILRKKLEDHEDELEECHRKIDNLEGAHETVRTLELEIKDMRNQIADRDATINDLEKDNKILNAQNVRADKLLDEVRTLKDDLNDREVRLSKALKSVKTLTIYKDRAIELEGEVKDLREQVNVQEKHLTYLEDALEAHENCAVEAKQLKDQIDMLENLLHEKEGTIAELQKANKGLKFKDTKIETLQKEIRTILHEMEAKDRASIKIQEKIKQDLDKLSSNASSLRTEVESLRQQLKNKNAELNQAHKGLEELNAEKDRNMQLTVEITSLEKMIADKGRQITNLEKLVDSMRGDAGRADRLEGEVKELQKEVRLGKKTNDQLMKDLSATSSTANTLRVEVASLQEKLSAKEKELADADKVAKELEQKSYEIQQLVSKISEIEKAQEQSILRAHNAEDKSKGLQADITTLEVRITGLQQQLKEKEADLNKAQDKANKDHEGALLHLNETRALVSDLKKKLKDAEKDSRNQLHNKDSQIDALKNDIKDWENHEESWVIKTNGLTADIENGIDLVRQKNKTINDLKHMMGEHNVEINRLNDVVNEARSKLLEDRKRRASEIEEKVTERTNQFNTDRNRLKNTISDLQGEIKHLEKKVRLDHDHEITERKLSDQIHELTLWKQTSIEQTKEWEMTIAKLEREKEVQVGMLTRYERQIHNLQVQVDGADAWRLKAIEQAERLTAMISKLEKELKILRGTLSQHDATYVKLNERIHTLIVQIEALERSRDDLQREARAKDAQIAELEERLCGETNSYKGRLADARREISVKDKKIEILNARIGEFIRQTADLESQVAQDKDSMATMESTLDKLRINLAAQIEKYKALDTKYQDALQTQADQDKQLYKLEKTLDRVTADDAEKVKGLESKKRHLEKELEKALKRVGTFQLDLHNVTRQYHDTLALLEDAKAQMAKMVPAEKASHVTCETRIRNGESEITKLSVKIADLKAQVHRLTKEQLSRDSAWASAESGYKDRIQTFIKNQHLFEAQLRDANNARDLEKAAHDQDLIRSQREKEKQDKVIQTLRHTQIQMQKEFTSMETRMRREMSAAKDLTDLLAKLRASIKRDSEAELRSLDELEKELKTRETVVEETIQTTRNRMDSGAFMNSTLTSFRSSDQHNIATH